MQGLAARLLNRPMLLLPANAEALVAAMSTMTPYGDADAGQRKAYEVVPPGIAVISVSGILVQKLGSCYSWGFVTGYDGIRKNIIDAFEDDEVKAIVLDIDSCGGDAAGCFDLADMIFGARGEKPIWAILNESGYSGAYAIASACNRVTIPRTGGAGSIGVIVLLADFSGALDQAGVKINVIQFGARKADGQPFAPLTDQARTRFQADVDTVGELFVETVARNRGLAASAVKDQQAGCFMGQNAVSAGLADLVAAPDAAFAQLVATIKT